MRGKQGLKARVLCGLLLCVCLNGCALLPQEEEVLPPPLVERQADLQFELAEVVRGDIAEQVTASGVLAAAEQTAYYFPVDGLRLLWLHVRAGDTVAVGDIIAQADPGDLAYRIQVQRNVARLAEIRLEKSTRADRETRQLELDNEMLALGELEKQLARCTLYSAQDGVVLFADNLKEGEAITPYRVLARVAAPDELVAYAQGDTLRQVRTGMRAQLTIGEHILSGTVTLSPDNVPDAADSRYHNAVFVLPDHLPEGVAMGTQVRMQITLQESTNALLVPQRALRTALGQTYVQVLSEGVRKEYQVKVGIRTTTQAEILSGLTEGMQVILK